MKIMLQALMRKLKMNMDEQMFLHSLGVMKTAVELAAQYNADIKKAEILIFFMTVPGYGYRISVENG